MREDPCALVRRIKHPGEGEASLSIVVVTPRGATVGSIGALDARAITDPTLAATLTRWRRAHMDAFLTRFEATEDRTRTWLAGPVLHDDTRLMFLVRTADGTLVGQFGLCGIGGPVVELDNGIRGETGGHPMLFHHVELAVLRFAFERLGAERAIANVLSTNVLALRLHKGIGLTEAGRVALHQEQRDGEVRLVPVDSDHPRNVEVEIVELVIERPR